jgi:hypothetical protein
MFIHFRKIISWSYGVDRKLEAFLALQLKFTAITA